MLNSTLPGVNAAPGTAGAAGAATATSQSPQVQRRFIYHAHAMGLAGDITSPSPESIDTQAPSVLGVSGGHSSSRVDSFAYKDLVSFGAAYTEVRGGYDQTAKAYVTEVAATMEHLNILNFITVDLISARLRSTFADEAAECSIVPLDSQIVNFRLGGFPVNVQLDRTAFSCLDTFEKLQARLKGDATFAASQGLAPYSDIGDIAVCTLATGVTSDVPGVQVQGNAIHLPQFGTVYLAELIFQPKLRTMGMFRIQLGSAEAMALRVTSNSPTSTQQGALMSCHASTDGEFYPP